MFPDSDNQDGLLSSLLRPDTLTGYVLTFLGVVILAAVLYETYLIFTDPGQLAAFGEVFSNEVTINWQDGFVTIPPEMLVYFFPLSLLSIGSGIGRGLLNSGIGLIRKKVA
jgi:hypothetical protein